VKAHPVGRSVEHQIKLRNLHWGGWGGEKKRSGKQKTGWTGAWFSDADSLETVNPVKEARLRMMVNLSTKRQKEMREHAERREKGRLGASGNEAQR